ncbi:BCCT transporter [Lysinibacillus contaminans]|uniref:BCCT transporter n=1 Tax=Lysinibacillus contaminans TaxID=1293441 RepID=A0ABR5K2E7_9BACI|nr:BCCT family transporter [Lysinibacillus contaminans]KOS69051.1 BCCT transporter [Lysinibacillus contaminans]
MSNKVEYKLIALTLVLLTCIVVPIVFWPNETSEVINTFFKSMTTDFAWAFLLIGFGCAVFAVFMMLSKYGSIRLGGEDAKPHYTKFTWISMIITSALAAGILIFGTVEWMYYVHGTPFGIEPKSVAAYETASAYGMFHWGFSASAFYLPASLAIGYMYWNRKAESMKISEACSEVLGKDKSRNSLLKLIIDGLVTFCFVGGMLITVGLGTSVLGELIANLLHIENTLTLRISIIVMFCIFFIGATSQSISTGMAKISNFNIYLALAFFLFVFLVGPKSFMLNNFVMAMGNNITNFVKMSFYTDAVAQTGFIQSWTIFYWAWYLGLSISIGLWVARVSYGRTFKEISMAISIFLPLACWISFGTLGNYGMGLEVNNIANFSDIAVAQGNSAATLAVLKTMPLSTIAIIVFVILVFFNLATSATSVSTVVAMLTSKNLKADEEPNKWFKVMWGCIFMVLPVAILYLENVVDGLNILGILQSFTSIFGIPMLFVNIILLWSAVKAIKADLQSGKLKL